MNKGRSHLSHLHNMAKYIEVTPLLSMDLRKMNIRQLKRLASYYAVKGYGRWTRMELIRTLEALME